MKNTVQKIIAGVLVSMCLFGLFGCGKNEDKGTPIEFSVSYEKIIHEKEPLNFIELIKSKEEMDNLCSTLWFCSTDLDPIYSQEKELYEKLRGYDEDFFKKNALVIYLLSEGRLIEKTTIKDLKVDGKLLEMILNREFDGAAADASTQWVFIAEVKQADIKDITEVKATIEYVKNK